MNQSAVVTGGRAKDVHRLGRVGPRLVTVQPRAGFIDEPLGGESSGIGDPGNDGERREALGYGET